MLYAISAIVVLLIIALIEPHMPRLKKESIAVSDLPDALVGFKIAYISDLHVDSEASLNRLKNAVATINGQSPDVVCLGGDYADTRLWADRAFDALDSLDAPVYAVRGNHDFGYDAHEIMLTHGVRICDNAGYWVEKDDARLRIAGVDDYIKSNCDAVAAIADAKESDVVILLAHNPLSTEDVARQTDAKLTDFALCGHTHGGQVTLFGVWGPLGDRPFPAFSTQWPVINGIKTLYSNGLGTTFIPLRFMAAPQIHIIALSR